MAWEKRGKNLYYYHKQRVGKRVISRYYGRGEIAEAVAHYGEVEQRRRDETLRKKAEIHRQHDRDRALDRQLDELSQLVRSTVCASLIGHGYHTHKGQWRKKRGNENGE
jgi:hypothetical protein